jgi:hypothetical protein
MDPQRLRSLVFPLTSPDLRRALSHVPNQVAYNIACYLLTLELAQRVSIPWELGTSYPSLINNKNGLQHLIVERSHAATMQLRTEECKVVFSWEGEHWEREAFWSHMR